MQHQKVLMRFFPLLLFCLYVGSTFGVESASNDEPVGRILFEQNLEKARAGDVEAMESIAYAFENGFGTEIDEKEAVAWLERASGMGSYLASSYLGDLYGRKKDYRQSFNWYKKASNHKYPWALFRLGVMYQKGWHVLNDTKLARSYFEEAAQLGSADAQHYVGVLYFQGEIFPKNKIAAYAWTSIAAAKDRRFVESRDSIERLMTSSELHSAQ